MVDYELPALSTLPPDIWGGEIVGAFGAFDAEVEAPRGLQALRSWRAALAGRWYAPARVVCIGSSTTAGVGATALDRRYVNKLGDLLHARYNPAGVAGGVHVAGVDSGWTTSGTVGTNGLGLGLQSVTLAIGATMSRTVNPCDRITVLFEQGPGAGQFTVAIDGGGATTVTPDTTGSAGRHDGTWTSSALTLGSHSVVITAVGACVISGAYFHIGDYAAGVQVYQSGKSGAVANDFTGGSIPTRVAQLGAGLAVVMLASNDYSTGVDPAVTGANITTLCTNIKAAAYPPPSIALDGTYRRLDTTAPAYPWRAYLDVMQEIAANDPANIAFSDLSSHFPASSSADHWNLIDTDLTHPTDRGHAHLADAAEQALRAPRHAAMRIHTPTRTAPDELTGLLSWWDASSLSLANNDPVSSWAPRAGAETAPLTQSGTNRPTFLTNQINGLPAVSFAAASSQSLDTGAWTASYPVPITIAAVVQIGLNGATPQNLWTGRNGVYCYAGTTPTILQVGAGAAGELNSRESPDLAWHVIVVVYNGSSSRIYWDSRSLTTRGTTGTGASAQMPGTRMATNSGNTANYLNGMFRHYAVFNRALASAEAAGLVAYMAHEHDLEVA
ncbi:SGNH/GDSL hydrolase family protein [Parafrankia sp. EUN1f]|uniref:SGNH/GDSL hydrolase family protein n=1 Tax=Parafrankia sp. EUN1f TaxID=102897 RepID=UPI0001C45308|nr:SGNH/GDSL hydrolase family protein [Parafrankia sp. EUN1f]EFC78980.1 hypothetical protein FrEUN1fDRAFT_7897 [Parafrankia sp. EUN1f]